MRLATVVVTYYPVISSVISNILSYINHTEILVVWNNSEYDVNDWADLHTCSKQLFICGTGANVGLGKAYNKAFEIAVENECTHLMTMDQDTSFVDFLNYRKAVESLQEFDFFCPTLNKGDNPIEVTMALQSGSIYSVKMLKKIGLFREDFFIGMIDAEISLRALANGFGIKQIGDCGLIHHIGSGRTITFLNHKVILSDYNALRHYYDSRNRILMWYEFPNDFDFAGKFHFFISRLKLIVKVLLFEDKKKSKIVAIIKGTWYGIKNELKAYNVVKQ